MEHVYRSLEIIGLVTGGLTVLAAALLGLWYSIKHRLSSDTKEEEERKLRPFRQALEGYESEVAQLKLENSRLEKELQRANTECDALRKKVTELTDLIVTQTAMLARQQGEIDKLKRKVEDLGNLESQITTLLTKMR